MVSRVSVQFVFRLMFVARQAERSVDYLLRNPIQLWEGFQAFYDEHDRNVELHDIHQKLEKLMDAPEAGFWLYFQIPIATFLGWRLMPASLVGQSVATLGDVIQLIDAEAPITAEELIRLRRSLHRIQVKLSKIFWIRNKLFFAAKQIEHYGQSDYKEFCGIEEASCTAK